MQSIWYKLMSLTTNKENLKGYDPKLNGSLYAKDGVDLDGMKKLKTPNVDFAKNVIDRLDDLYTNFHDRYKSNLLVENHTVESDKYVVLFDDKKYAFSNFELISVFEVNHALKLDLYKGVIKGCVRSFPEGSSFKYGNASEYLKIVFNFPPCLANITPNLNRLDDHIQRMWTDDFNKVFKALDNSLRDINANPKIHNDLLVHLVGKLNLTGINFNYLLRTK